MEENLQWFKIMAHYEAVYTNVGYNTTKFKPQIMSGSRPISTFLGYSIYSLFIGPIGFQWLFKQQNKNRASFNSSSAIGYSVHFSFTDGLFCCLQSNTVWVSMGAYFTLTVSLLVHFSLWFQLPKNSRT